MFDNSDVIDYFDSIAENWDSGTVKDESVVEAILDNAKVLKGNTVLDVACGTGILICDYLKREVSSVTGIDISPGMIKMAKQKYSLEQVRFICCDAVKFKSREKYDRIVIYNAFPHFTDPDLLLGNLCSLLEPDGYLTVAHGSAREVINKRHSDQAHNVSNSLLSIEEMEELFRKYLRVTFSVSDGQMYQVVGTKDIGR